MDFDTAKENIQPLRQGRRADRLEIALGEQSKESLENEKRQLEENIAKYDGLDPLAPWYDYICWIEQSFPKSGSECGLDGVVIKCIVNFEEDTRYRQDRRMIKLYIKYIDTQKDPHECYSQLYNSGIGTLVADLYIAWSYYFDALNDYKQVEAIFRKGFDAGAQPFEDLTQAHQAFGISMSRRMLYDDEGSKKQFQATMEEKRSALTSLRAHKKKFVGSLRTGIAVKDANPGIVNQENLQLFANTNLAVHEDEQDAAAAVLPPNTSVIRSIIDNAKKNENVHEPGPWNKAKLGKSGKLFGRAGALSQPGFAIMEDENLPPIPCPENLFEKGIQLPEGFVRCNKPLPLWNIPIVVEEPIVSRSIPKYEKFYLYPNKQKEISADEYRAFKWFKNRGMRAPVTEEYEHVWSQGFDYPIRIPPGFVSKNVPQVEKQDFPLFIEDEQSADFQVPLQRMYPGNGEVLSFEELMAEKFKRGGIRLATEEDFEEVCDSDDMEITVIGDRRQSIYPGARKSIVPRKSIISRKSFAQPPPIEEDEEEEDQEEEAEVAVIKPLSEPRVRFESQVDEQSSGAIPKSIFKRKMDEEVTANQEDQATGEKREFVAETPPRSNFNSFKPPAPVEKKTRPFELEDEDGPYCTANDTCSTQQFNFFIKAQSVSTPVSKKNIPKLLPLAASQVEESNSNVSPTNCESTAAPVSTTPGSSEALGPKQLSTIMETTEQSKSSVSHATSDNDTDMHTKTPKNMQNSNHHVVSQLEVEKRLFNPMLASFRMPEDQTETCSTIMMPIRVVPNLEVFATPAKMMRSLKAFDIVAPSFDVFEDETIKSPSKMESLMKSPGDNSMKLPEHEFEIPVTQPVDFEAPETESENNESLEIPATQDLMHAFEVPATQNDEIPETQDMDDIEIPATQDMEDVVPATSKDQKASPKEAVKEDSFCFNIYEDSVKEVPKQQGPVKFNLPDEDGTGFLHMSRKENLLVRPAATKRTVSDDFLDLLMSPQKPKMDLRQSKVGKVDISDLLKFSAIGQVSGCSVSLENSLKNLSIELPKSGTPTSTTPNLFDDDLNTEKFSSALGNLKNSTLLIDNSQRCSRPAPQMISHLDMSIELDEYEMGRLGFANSLTNVDEIQDIAKNVQPEPTEFKVPQAPVFKAPSKPISKPPLTSNFRVFEDDDDTTNALSKSIYFQKPIVEPDFEEVEKLWDGELMASFIANACNQYEHTIAEDNHNLSLKVQEAIGNSRGNPFDARVREAMLEHCNFSPYLEEHVKSCVLLKKIPLLKPGVEIECSDQQFSVVKFITKGGFGSIFTAKNTATGELMALKQEKPANLWEYYICVELKDRLKDKRMGPAFMNIEYAIVANNASVFVTQFSPFGTIIDICNKYKNIYRKNLDEYVVMVLTSQLLSIIDHMHGCKIIHGDIKPDNFLLMTKIEFGMKVPALQLIDFGAAVDMDWYKKDETFTYVVKTEHFICCEMMEKKPWTYQIDLFGLAGTAHVMLFGSYMEVEKKTIGWNIKSKFPRYLNKLLWEQFFNTLLNVANCRVMPNLQALKDQFEEEIYAKEKFVCDKISEFNQALISNS